MWISSQKKRSPESKNLFNCCSFNTTSSHYQLRFPPPVSCGKWKGVERILPSSCAEFNQMKPPNWFQGWWKDCNCDALTKILQEFEQSIQGCDNSVPNEDSTDHPKEKKNARLHFPTKYFHGINEVGNSLQLYALWKKVSYLWIML